LWNLVYFLFSFCIATDLVVLFIKYENNGFLHFAELQLQYRPLSKYADRHSIITHFILVGCEYVTVTVQRCCVCVEAVNSGVGGSSIGFGNSSTYATLGRPVSLPISRMPRVLSSSDPDLTSSNPTSPDNDMANYSGQFGDVSRCCV